MVISRVGLILVAFAVSGAVGWGQAKPKSGLRAEPLASGKVSSFGNGVIVIESKQGNRTIALSPQTAITVEMKVLVTELPPNSRVALGGLLDPATLKITQWHLSLLAAGAGGGNGVTVPQDGGLWEVKYTGTLQSVSPLRIATVRGTSYIVRGKSVDKSVSNQLGGKQATASQEIRNPRRDLEGAVFTLELSDAEDQRVSVTVPNQPQLVGDNATADVQGVQGPQGPVATSIAFKHLDAPVGKEK